MRRFKNKKTGKIYIYAAAGVDCTNSRDGTAIVVYYPDDNVNTIYVREESEFFEKFEEFEMSRLMIIGIHPCGITELAMMFNTIDVTPSLAYNGIDKIDIDTTGQFSHPVFLKEAAKIIEKPKKKHWAHLNKGAYKQGRK